MTLTLEERAEVSRKNGAKSRGPVTEAGKLISRENSLKLEIYARVVHLADEDPEKIAAVRQQYYHASPPRSAAAQPLLEDCIYADLSSRRYRLAHDATVANQAA